MRMLFVTPNVFAVPCTRRISRNLDSGAHSFERRTLKPINALHSLSGRSVEMVTHIADGPSRRAGPRKALAMVSWIGVTENDRLAFLAKAAGNNGMSFCILNPP